jgi:Hemerythrin HHE cation binding domain
MNERQIDIYVSVHKGIRNIIGQFSYVAGRTDWDNPEAVSGAHDQWIVVTRILRSHQQHEDHFIHPLLARISHGSHRDYESEHQTYLTAIDNLDGPIKRLLEGNGTETRKAEIGLGFYRQLNLFYADFLKHLHREEVEAERILNALCLPDELMVMMGQLIGSIPQDELLSYMDCMIPAINLLECVEFLGNMKSAAPAGSFKTLAERVREIRGEADWAKIKYRLGM